MQYILDQNEYSYLKKMEGIAKDALNKAEEKIMKEAEENVNIKNSSYWCLYNDEMDKNQLLRKEIEGLKYKNEQLENEIKCLKEKNEKKKEKRNWLW